MSNSIEEKLKIEPRPSVAAFFESCPPGTSYEVAELLTWKNGPGWFLQTQDLYLHCDSEKCLGMRYFDAPSLLMNREGMQLKFATFTCKNCHFSRKTFAFSAVPSSSDELSGKLFKYGEYPPFGPPTPAKVISLIGGERDYFLKGRRCENQGLGIAAFAYYRRVVENQKSKILSEIHRVAVKLGAPEKLLAQLVAAQNETQFSRAVDSIKEAIPQVLLINGHNPLTLLHSALSEGLHATTDHDCLELATSIRVVLTELVDRMNTAVKEEAELNSAVSRLLRASRKK